MAEDDQEFLKRWSQRKHEAARRAANPPPAAAAPPPAPAAAAPLPPVESLDIESDFRAFMQADVADGVKRAALKKLFSDPHFHFDQMDKLDIGIDDYAQGELLPEEMLAKLEHAKNALFGPRPEPESAERAKEAARGDEPPPAAAREDDGARG